MRDNNSVWHVLQAGLHEWFVLENVEASSELWVFAEVLDQGDCSLSTHANSSGQMGMRGLRGGIVIQDITARIQPSSIKGPRPTFTSVALGFIMASSFEEIK